ncbi:MAG: GAF domain-containing protein [Spirochaetaceae bacterium]|nr:GAF domain-containing protein [Spirochaetaceae bacterium]
MGKILQVDRSYIFLFSEDGSNCSNTHEWCEEGIALEKDNLQHIPSELIPWWLAQLQKKMPLIIPKVTDLPVEAVVEKETLEAQGVQSVLIVPMMYEESLYGFIGLDSVRTARSWSDEDVDSMRLLSGIVTHTLKRKELSIQRRKEQIELKELNSELEQRDRERREKLVDYVKRLNKANEMVVQQEKLASIGRLSAGIAHEINNPVGYIVSNITSLTEYIEVFFRLYERCVDLLSMVEAEGTQKMKELAIEIHELQEKEDFEFIREDVEALMVETTGGADRVKKIVTELKNFAHRDDSEKKPVNLSRLIERAMRVVHHEMKYTCEVQNEFAELPEIRARENQIMQVLINILVNAVHSLPEDDGLIRIYTFRDGHYAVIRIEDNGSGIEGEHLAHIFEPFYTTKDMGKGTGLGLSISLDIINDHGGTIDVSSTIGKGTTFDVKLPISGETVS